MKFYFSVKKNLSSLIVIA